MSEVHSRIVILDFGSQYTQVIARRIRECQVYSQILPYNTKAKDIAKLNPKGLILSGGPSSVYGKNAPHPDPAIFELGIPVLGICYGAQLMASELPGWLKWMPPGLAGRLMGWNIVIKASKPRA